MGVLTKTYVEDALGGGTQATWTVTLSNNDVIASGNTFSFTLPTLTARYNVSASTGRKYGALVMDCKIVNSQCHYYSHTDSTTTPRVSWNIGETKTFSKNETATLNTSSYFTASNKTTRSVYLPVNAKVIYLQSADAQSMGSDVNSYLRSASGYTISVGDITKVTLDVPPTATVSAMSFDTGYVYAGLTTASVTISDAAAYYGGDVTSIELAVGSQTDTISGNGTLSIALANPGTFTPTVTITDSRGQTKTYTLPAITVNTYTAPTVSFDVDRTDSTGTPDDEGTCGLIEATLTFADAVADAVAPSVVLTDENGTQTTPVVTWYTDNTLQTTVTWANVSSGDTIYGLFSGLNTNYSYTVSVRPRDSQGTGTAISQTISAAFYTVDFLAGGHGIAFGQPSSVPGFYCNMDAHFVDANSVMRALFDFIHPVGSYYETSDTAFDPNVTWGGTWALEAEGQVHVSAGANYTVSGALTDTTDGGEATHTLITAEMPSHYHGSNWTIPVYQGSSSTHTSGTAWTANNRWYSAAPSNLTKNTGGGGAHNNMQPYIIVNRWHRTA